MNISSNQWAAIIGVTVGAVAAVAIAQNNQLNQALVKYASNLRLPDPGFAMALPLSRVEFERLDALACQCLAQQTGAPDVDTAAACMGRILYPMFEWPPTTGDHPSVPELWQDLRLTILRQLAFGNCAPRS